MAFQDLHFLLTLQLLLSHSPLSSQIRYLLRERDWGSQAGLDLWSAHPLSAVSSECQRSLLVVLPSGQNQEITKKRLPRGFFFKLPQCAFGGGHDGGFGLRAWEKIR